MPALPAFGTLAPSREIFDSIQKKPIVFGKVERSKWEQPELPPELPQTPSKSRDEGGMCGTLDQHCSHEEMEMRRETRQLDRFELAMASTLLNPQPNPLLCLKKYQRSAADKVYPASETRTFRALQSSMNHLVENVVDCDLGRSPPFAEFCNGCTFSDIYSFFRDRTRAIRVDLHVQQPRSLQSDVYFRVHEQCLRFEFLAMYLLRRPEFSTTQYDDKLGLKSCSQTMEPLLHAYSLFPSGASEHCRTMYRYVVLLQIGTHQGLSFTSRWSKAVLNDPLVKWALQAAGAFYSEDYGRFLRMYKQADFMSAVLMARVVDFVRYRILCSILRSLVVNTKETMWTLGQLQSCLAINDPAFCTEFLEYFGLWVEGNQVRFPKRTGPGQWDMTEWEEVLDSETAERFRQRIGNGGKMMHEWEGFPRNQDPIVVEKYKACGICRGGIIRGEADPKPADFPPISPGSHVSVGSSPPTPLSVHSSPRSLGEKNNLEPLTPKSIKSAFARPATPSQIPTKPSGPNLFVGESPFRIVEKQPINPANARPSPFFPQPSPLPTFSSSSSTAPAFPCPEPRGDASPTASDVGSSLPPLEDPERERRREEGRLRRAYYFRLGRIFFAWADVHRTEKKWRQLPIAQHPMPPPRRPPREIPIPSDRPPECRLKELPLPTGPLVGEQDLYKRIAIVTTSNGPRIRDFVLNIERFLRQDDEDCASIPDIGGSRVLHKRQCFRRFTSVVSLASARDAYNANTQQWARLGFINVALVVMGNAVPVQESAEGSEMDRLNEAEKLRLLALKADEYRVLFYLDAAKVHSMDEVETTRRRVEHVFRKSLELPDTKSTCVGAVLNGTLHFDSTTIERVLARSKAETAIDMLEEVKIADWAFDVFFEEFYEHADDSDCIAFSPPSRRTGLRVPYWPYSEDWVEKCWDATWENLRSCQDVVAANAQSSPPEWAREPFKAFLPKLSARRPRFERTPMEYWLGLRRDLHADIPQTIMLPRSTLNPPADLTRVDMVASRTESRRRRRRTVYDDSSSVGDYSDFRSDTISICASADFAQRDREQSAWEKQRVAKRMKQFESALSLIQNAAMTVV